MENKVQEEVLYREALTMGLDKDDTIVKRRMAQKMQFLAEDVAAAHEPTTDELKSWYEKNDEKLAALVGFFAMDTLTEPNSRRAKARCSRSLGWCLRYSFWLPFHPRSSFSCAHTGHESPCVSPEAGSPPAVF